MKIAEKFLEYIFTRFTIYKNTKKVRIFVYHMALLDEKIFHITLSFYCFSSNHANLTIFPSKSNDILVVLLADFCKSSCVSISKAYLVKVSYNSVLEVYQLTDCLLE